MLRRWVTSSGGALVVLVALISGCGGSDPYCDAVEQNRTTLDAFGSTRTTVAFSQYASTLSVVAESAPTSSRSQWNAMADATRGVIEAHAKVGLKLDDMKDTAKRAELDPDQVETLNAAYATFNATVTKNELLVKDVRQHCDIDLDPTSDR